MKYKKTIRFHKITVINSKLYKVTCNTKEIANKLISEQPVKDFNIECNIPYYTSVVINDVETDFNEQGLTNLLSDYSWIYENINKQ